MCILYLYYIYVKTNGVLLNFPFIKKSITVSTKILSTIAFKIDNNNTSFSSTKSTY